MTPLEVPPPISDISSLLPMRVRDVDLYDPARKPITYDLSDNTSQWGMAPGVRDSIVEAANDEFLSRYPDIYAGELKRAIAVRFSDRADGLSENNIVVGCGTDDVLDCIVRAVTNEADTVVMQMPSFPMAGYFAQYNGREVRGVALERDGSIDIAGICEGDSKLVYLCNPNNPTGQEIPREQIVKLAETYNGFIVIDEAYAEFSQEDCLPIVNKYDNLIIVRTFSKIHALAGLRIGYSIAQPAVASAIEAVRGPYKANSIAIAAALMSLAQKDYQENVVSEVVRVRDWFTLELESLGLSPLPSKANFVFVPITMDEAVRDLIKVDLAAHDIAVRIFDQLGDFGSGVRITLTTQDILEKVVDVLRKYAS